MVGEVVCGLYDEVEVGIVVVFEDFGDVYGGVGVEVELVGDGVCALVFALVEFACLWCGDVEGRVEVGYGYRVDELAGLSDDSVGDDFGFSLVSQWCCCAQLRMASSWARMCV